MTVAYVVLLYSCRNGVDSQVQRIELSDITVLVKDCIGLDTGRVVVLVVSIPMERQIQFADGLVMTTLFNHVEVTDTIATGTDLSRVTVIATLRDVKTVPVKRLAVVEQNCLRVLLNG